jgi:hypothetical protein
MAKRAKKRKKAKKHKRVKRARKTKRVKRTTRARKVKTVRANPTRLEKLVNEISTRGEGIKILQQERRSVLEVFGRERQRYSNGQISEYTFQKLTKRMSSDLARLDSRIRQTVKTCKGSAKKLDTFLNTQVPSKSPQALATAKLPKAKKKKAVKKKRAKPKKAAKPAQPKKAKKEPKPVEKPKEEKPVEEKPVEKPAEEKPQEEKPAESAPSSGGEGVLKW